MKVTKSKFTKLIIVLWLLLGLAAFFVDPESLKFSVGATFFGWLLLLPSLFFLRKVYPECSRCKALNPPRSVHCHQCGEHL